VDRVGRVFVRCQVLDGRIVRFVDQRRVAVWLEHHVDVRGVRVIQRHADLR
jgi:hypothetical protein